MIYLLPLLISFLIYIIYEEQNIVLYGIFSLLLILIFSSSFINYEIIIIIFITLILLWYIFTSFNDKTSLLLIIVFIIGTYLTILSTSIISLFISIEILSFTIIIYINLYIQDQYPGIIYFLLSGLFTAIFIISLGYLYMGYIITYKFIFIVFLFKLGLIPFHIILPMIYINLSPKKILLIDIPYKTILFYTIYRLDFHFNIQYYIIFLLITSTLFSLRYKNLLFIMIYSSIFNYALILIAIYLKNINLFIYYIIFYSIFIIIFLYLITNYLIYNQFQSSFYLYIWLLLLFNFIGIPPLSGFIIKFNILSLLIINNLYSLLIISLLSIILISYTYIRILINMFMNNNNYIIYNNNSYQSNFFSFLITFISIPLFY